MSKYLGFAIPPPVQITKLIGVPRMWNFTWSDIIIHISEEKEAMGMKLHSKKA